MLKELRKNLYDSAQPEVAFSEFSIAGKSNLGIGNIRCKYKSGFRNRRYFLNADRADCADEGGSKKGSWTDLYLSYPPESA